MVEEPVIVAVDANNVDDLAYRVVGDLVLITLNNHTDRVFKRLGLVVKGSHLTTDDIPQPVCRVRSWNSYINGFEKISAECSVDWTEVIGWVDLSMVEL